MHPKGVFGITARPLRTAFVAEALRRYCRTMLVVLKGTDGRMVADGCMHPLDTVQVVAIALNALCK